MHILFLVQAIELQLQLSNSQLHHALEDRTWQCSQLELQLNTLREQIAEQSVRVQAAKAIEDVQTRELHAIKGTLRAKDLELCQLQRTLDRQAQHLVEIEAEVESYKKSVEVERERHQREMAEICDERVVEEDRARAMFARLTFSEVDSICSPPFLM